MIELIVITTLVFSIVIGFYGIVLLQQMRSKFTNEYLNSFFYYQILTILFGLYGIIGNLILSKILLKFGLKTEGIETISLFFSLIGLPFLIAAWYLQIKMVTEICSRKVSQLTAVVYFSLTTLAFLLYGFYFIKLHSSDIQPFSAVRENVFLGFCLAEVIVVAYIVAILLIAAIANSNKNSRIFVARLACIIAFITIFKTLALYFSNYHLAIGLYFIISFFGGSLPIIFLIKKELNIKTSYEVVYSNSISKLFDQLKITPREKEIIIEICKGKTNQQIANDLFITLQTVKDHTHNIFQKTGVKNRVQLSQKFSIEAHKN